MKSSRSLASFKWTNGGSLVAQLGKAPEFSLLRLGSLLWYWFDPWHQNFHTPWVQPKQTQKEGNCISRISPALIAYCFRYKVDDDCSKARVVWLNFNQSILNQWNISGHMAKKVQGQKLFSVLCKFRHLCSNLH